MFSTEHPEPLHTANHLQALHELVSTESQFISTLKTEINKSIIGQKNMIDRLIIALLCNGHVLLESVPGLAKTLATKTLASAINAQFSRIQFTPDLLPADLIGTMIYSPAENKFFERKGPIFANFVLADEINRAPGKVQSALLEAMQEFQVTIGNTTYPLPKPFFVLATQNPLEQEGTYPLPEAQLDRFMLKVILDYPSFEEEQQVMQLNVNQSFEKIQPVISTQNLLQAQKIVRQLYIDPKIENYILNLVFASRYPQKNKNLQDLQPYISYGASPRASINLAIAAKANAFMKHRAYVIPDDVQAIAPDVLRHRIGITYEAEAENITTEHIVNQIISNVEVP